MQYFDRVCKLVIESESKITIEHNRINFELTKSANPQENIGRIEVWNLASDTRKLISDSNSLVRLFAGYSQNQGLIEVGQGDITNVRTSRNQTDTVTQIYFSEGQKKVTSEPVSFSYEDNFTLGDALKTITNQTGLTFKKSGIDSGRVIEGGYSAMGSLDEVLDALSLEFDFNWSIQNGVILLIGRAPTQSKEIMLLGPKTGLILNPETVKKISRKLSKSDAPLEPTKYSIQSLMQPQLQVNDTIALKSNDLNGNFRITKVSHTGDTRNNDWYSNIEVIAS